MANMRNITTLANVFQAMSDPTRLQLLFELQKGPQSVTALYKKLKAGQPTVSHHLSLLRQARLVIAGRRGRRVFYHINGEQLRNRQAVAAVLNGPAGLQIGPLVFGLGKR